MNSAMYHGTETFESISGGFDSEEECALCHEMISEEECYEFTLPNDAPICGDCFFSENQCVEQVLEDVRDGCDEEEFE